MKKRLIIVAIGILLCGFLLPIVFNSLRYRMNPIAAALIPLVDGTDWAPNYSFWKFRQIDIGMTTNDVLSILGPCIAITQYEDQTQWHYTRGKDGGVMSESSFSTHFRIISFGPDGRTTSKTYDFYFD